MLFAQMGHAVLLSLLALTGTAAAAVPGPKLELRHTHSLDESYRLEAITWWLDGAELATWRGGGQEAGPEIQLRPVDLEAGMHSLAVTVVYEGHSKLFPYLNGYRFLMRARMVIDARPGSILQLDTEAFEKSGLTVGWRDRPQFRIEGVPREAFIEQELLPVDGVPPGTQAPPELAVVPAAGRTTGAHTLATVEEVEVSSGCAELWPIHFSFSGFRLNARARRQLDALSACMVKHPELQVVLTGHCDSRGPEGYNLTLSDWRLDSAQRYLVSRGVLAERVQAQSFGETRPLCEEDSEVCHARNRRVEFELGRPVGKAAADRTDATLAWNGRKPGERGPCVGRSAAKRVASRFVRWRRTSGPATRRLNAHAPAAG